MPSESGRAESGDARVPISDVLRGLEIHPLDTGETAIEAFVLIKLLDANGDATWSFRTTNRLNDEELLGALTVQAELLRQKLVTGWDDA